MDTNVIKVAPLFAGLDEDESALLAENFSASHYAEGEALYSAGEQSESLFLLDKGFARLSTESGQNLATLGAGSVLGEAYLFRNTPYDVTATAISEIDCWRLSDQKLRSVILQKPSIGLKLSKSFGSMPAQMEDYLVAQLGKADELRNLPPHTLKSLAGRLQPRSLRSGETLFRSGDAASGLYLVESGAIDLRADGAPVGEEPKSAGAGSVLGTVSLLTNKPNAEDAIARDESFLWGITAQDFQELNSSHPGLRRILSSTVRARLSKDDQSKAAMRMSEMPLFAELPPDAMRAITQRMNLQHVSAGERVYRIGDVGDAIYLVESGEIELTAENANGVIEELARIQDNGFFGEMSILTGQIRTEDATATRNTNLWVLQKSELDALSTTYPAISSALSQGLATRLASEQAENEERFRKFGLFADLSTEDLAQVTRYLQPTRYRPGEMIYRASTPSQTLYLSDEGQVRVQTFNGGSWVLGPGKTFGERAMLTNQPHSGSVTAETDVDLWTLSKTDFDVLLAQFPSLALSLSRMLSQKLGESNAYTPSPLGAPAVDGSDGIIQQEQYAQGQYAQGQYAPEYRQGATVQGEYVQGAAYTPAASTTASSLGSGRYIPQDGMDGAAVPGALVPPSTAIGVPAHRQQTLYEEDINNEPQQRVGFGRWYRGLSGFAKLRLVIIILLLLWLLGIALPLAMLSIARGASIVSAALFPVNSSNALSAVYSMGSYEVAISDQNAAMQIAMADSQAQPSPTYTPFPTSTPIPSSTPLPTNTPRPTPTFTPSPQAVAFAAAPAVAAPVEEEPVVQAASLPARAWDPRLDQLGVRVDPANVAPGEKYMRLIEASWWDEQESGGKHHIYVEVLDENGDRIVGHPVRVWWGDGEYIGPVEDKAFPEYGFNYQMYAAGYAYNVRVEGYPSESVHGAGMGDLDRRFYGIHTSFRFVFKLTEQS